MKRWADALEYFRIGVSWGGHESLVIVNPAPEKFADNGRAPSLVRIFIGMEDPDELIADIDRAWSVLPAAD